MKIILIGTNHSNHDEEVEVTIEQSRYGRDDWTFTLPHIQFTISDLTRAMGFLKKDFSKGGQ